jgi:tRNA A37 methylthiotransferase MiaB
MMNPLLTERILDELVECLHNDKVFKFVHLPVQSGSERILREMQRGYTVEGFESIVGRLRDEISDLTLSTDMIVAFPTETEPEFEQSLQLLRRTRPDVLNISRFGARSGTKAAGMYGQIKPEVSKKRSSIMTELTRKIQNDVNSGWIGWKGKALIDEKVRGALVARNFAYKPCLIKYAGMNASELMGKEVEVLVRSSTSSTLHAELLQ